MKQRYNKMSDEDLRRVLGEFAFRIMQTYTFSKKGEKPENRALLRKEIARIKTEQRMRR